MTPLQIKKNKHPVFVHVSTTAVTVEQSDPYWGNLSNSLAPYCLLLYYLKV